MNAPAAATLPTHVVAVRRRVFAVLTEARDLLVRCGLDAESGDPAIVHLVIAADAIDSAHAAMAAALEGAS